MPVYNGISFLKESLQSIQGQTFQDWEFLIVNEFGSDDGSRELIETYASEDSRIRLIQNTERLGLAKSLNIGIALAQGEYIARVDVDDPSYPTRFEKQVSYMDSHPDVVLCGAIQRSVTPTGENVQWVSTDWESLKASMIFGCEISHCSVMLRKQFFIDNGLKYDSNALSEDYDLWSKILYHHKIVNLNEVLVDHRWGFENISIQKGERLRAESRAISSRILKTNFGIDCEKEGIDEYLLSGWNSKPMEYASKKRARFLKEGFHLLQLLSERNKELQIVEESCMKQVLTRRWNWVCESCQICFNKELTFVKDREVYLNPVVSVVLPVFNSAQYLRESIDSVITQTYKNWELILLNEYGSDDGSVEICKWYEMQDCRIHLIQNKEKLGLGASLNKGFKLAKGRYIARLDADDLAHPKRFEKQVAYLEKHPKVGICGGWQHHFGNTNWVHRPAVEPEQCKANLLFWCDLCHSTLMLRKEVVEKYQLYFDINYMAEDFELWTRALRVTQIANIPEILGEYRCGEDNITNEKREDLRKESGYIVAKQLQENLNIDLPEEKYYLLNGWGNPYLEANRTEKEKMLSELKSILVQIWEANIKFNFYKENALLTIINSKWKWAKYNSDWHEFSNPYCIDRVFDEHYILPTKVRLVRFMKENKGIKKKLKLAAKKVLKPIARPITNRFQWLGDRVCDHYNNVSWNRTQYITKSMDSRIWKAEQRIIQNEGLLCDISFENNKVPFFSGEKIRIVFIFQVASFWPSIEPFYESVRDDSRFDVQIICYDEDYDRTIKTDTARRYLEGEKIKYIPYENFDIDAFRPHVVVVQTPYDTNRAERYKSTSLKAKGYRVVYIPYGIEIAATEHARQAHFNEAVVKNCWRLYTLSEVMKQDYNRYCENASAVRALGLPKFDALYYSSKYPLWDEVIQQANGRPIILWKVHFPKVIQEHGENILVTPYIDEYIAFARKLKQYEDLFFIFMPHPRFREFNEDSGVRRSIDILMKAIEKEDNVYIDTHDDYRNSLVGADAVIVDRSAVMVEAGGMGVPVMYMYNPDFNEPLTDAIKNLISTYYQGTTCADIERFIDMFRDRNDPQKIERDATFRMCVSYFDGRCGERIKEDIIEAIQNETNQSFQDKKEITERIDALDKKLDARIWRAEERLQKSFDEVHTQIDFSYRDILIVLEKQLNFIGKHSLVLNTKYPCAYESNDYLFPRGTAQDNTRYPRFIKKCESILGKDRDMCFLDLGCSGGGMVLDAIIRGHFAIGLEGSDLSFVQQRAEWRLLRNNLFTCDITKPFLLVNEEVGETKQFDVITAWEVLEHIQENDLEQLFKNIKKHLKDDGIFVGSISSWDDIDPESGVNWHVTVKPHEWWSEKFRSWGFAEYNDLMNKVDLARGGVNHPVFYKEPSESSHKNDEFFVVLKKEN